MPSQSYSYAEKLWKNAGGDSARRLLPESAASFKTLRDLARRPPVGYNLASGSRRTDGAGNEGPESPEFLIRGT